jgi:sec-independent protein translocase protein TatA
VGEFSPWHLLILAGIFVVLFGAKRLPDAARSLGQSARIFKSETKALHESGSAPTPAVPVAPPVATPAPTAPAAAAPVAPAPVAPQPVATPPAQAPQA